MINLILSILLFTLPFAYDNKCYYIGQIKTSLLFIGSTWLGYFLYFKKPKLPDISVLLFFVWVALSYIFYPYRLGDPLEALLTYASYLIVYIAARDYFTQKKTAICMELLIYVFALMTAWIMYHNWWYDHDKLLNFGMLDYKLNFGNPGIMACWLAMSIAFLAVNKRIIPVLIGLSLLWLTGSRASTISAILALSVALAIHSKAKWKKIAIGIVGLLLISCIFYKYANRLSPQQERVSYWDSAVQMIIDKPIGRGLGSFRINYPLYRNPIINDRYSTVNVDLQHSHNLFLEMGTELGIIGVGLFLLVIYRHWKMGQEWGLILGTMACLISNITDISYFYQPCGFLFWVMLGLMGKDIISRNWLDNAMDDFYNR